MALTKHFCFVMFLFAVFSDSICSAAPALTKSSEQVSELQDITIPLSHGELQAEIEAEQMQRDRANAPKSSLEFTVSTWQPASVNIASRVTPSSGFEVFGSPNANLNVISPIGSQGWNFKFGISFLMLHRFGTLTTSGQTARLEQTAYLSSLRTGLEFFPAALSSRTFHPYVSGAVLPSLFMTSRSAFDDGIADFGFGYELGLGTLVHIFNGIDLNFGAVKTFGHIKDSELQDFAILAGLRVHL